MNPLPTVALGPHQVTRLIVGGNPIRGYSHRSPEMDADMRTYYTAENVCKLLFDCERAGLNAMVSRGDRIVFDWIRQYREQGGTMHWICQTAPEWEDTADNIRAIAQLDPIAIYHHGGATDRMWKEGRIDEVKPYLQLMRDLGVVVGLAAHIPEVIEYAEEHDWDVDFYMACVYNLSKVQRESLLAGGKRVEEPFDDPDREAMGRVVRSTAKTCLAFKVLAASRKCDTPEDVRAALRFAFDLIKPTDAVVVGMFQKYTDQAAENAATVGEICQDAGRPSAQPSTDP